MNLLKRDKESANKERDYFSNKVRKIEIKTKRLSENIFAGRYHSAFKGRGMAFSEVRDYQYGDDIRDIDWNVTARFSHTYVKVFEEERELSVMLLIDLSSSLDFGTMTMTKRELVAEIAATIAFSVIKNNDKIGVIFFSDKIEKYIPPKTGRRHILYIINELLTFQPSSKLTDINQAIEFFNRIIKRSSTAFILSDFFDNNSFERSLTIANKKHDIIAIQVYDQLLTNIPDVGLLTLHDAETDENLLIDTSSKSVRKQYGDNWAKKIKSLNDVFQSANVDSISVSTNDDYVSKLINLFNRRK